MLCNLRPTTLFLLCSCRFGNSNCTVTDGVSHNPLSQWETPCSSIKLVCGLDDGELFDEGCVEGLWNDTTPENLQERQDVKG